MKTEDKIILYLDNQMNEEEKALFEKELERSEKLRPELDNHKKYLKEITSVKDIITETSYFTEMIPKFHGRLDLKRRMRFLPKLAFGTTAIAAVMIIMFFAVNRNIDNKAIIINKTANQSSTSSNAVQIESTSDLNLLSDQFNIGNLSPAEITYSNSVLDSLLYKELNLSPQSLSDYTFDSNQDLSSVVQGINEKEADEIYDQLLHKKIY